MVSNSLISDNSINIAIINKYQTSPLPPSLPHSKCTIAYENTCIGVNPGPTLTLNLFCCILNIKNRILFLSSLIVAFLVVFVTILNYSLSLSTVWVGTLWVQYFIMLDLYYYCLCIFFRFLFVFALFWIEDTFLFETIGK